VVDYSAHIVHFYMFENDMLEHTSDAALAIEDKESEENEKPKPKGKTTLCIDGIFRFAHPLATARMHEVMVEMAPNVMLGGASTLLGISILGFASSEIFRTFFRMMLATNVFGLLHGLILVPVLLSFYVPSFLTAKEAAEEAKEAAEEEAASEAKGALENKGAAPASPSSHGSPRSASLKKVDGSSKPGDEAYPYDV